MKSLEEKRKERREYMRKYNKTPKGQAYNRKHVKIWKKKTKAPHGQRKQISAGWRDIILDFLIKRDGHVCGICGESLEGAKMEINHIIPVALGGLDIMENVNLAHKKCNQSQAMKIRQQAYGY